MKKEKVVNFNLRMTQGESKKVEELAKMQIRSKNEVIRNLIREAKGKVVNV